MNLIWIVLAYLSIFIFGISDNLRGPLFADLLHEFSLSNSRGSLFFSVSSLISIVGALIAPKIIQTHGHLTSLWVFMLMMGLAFIGYSQAGSFEFVLFCAVIFGVAVGGLMVTQNLLVLQASDDAHRSRAQGGLHSTYGLSSLLAPGIVIVVAWTGLEWKTNFLIPGLLSLILVGVIALFSLREKAKVVGSKENENSAAAMASLGPPEFFWAILLSLYVALELMVSTRFTLLLREGFAFELASASLWTSMFFVGLFVGRLAYTLKPLPFRLSAQMALSLGLGAGMLALGILHRPEWIALSGFALSIFYPVWMTSIAKTFPDSFQRVASLGIGLTGVSVVLMHTVIAALTDQLGLRLAYWAVPILAAVTTLMVLLFPSLYRQRLGAARMP